MYYKHLVQSHCNMCLFGICSKLLALPYTLKFRSLIKKSDYIKPTYLTRFMMDTKKHMCYVKIGLCAQNTVLTFIGSELREKDQLKRTKKTSLWPLIAFVTALQFWNSKYQYAGIAIAKSMRWYLSQSMAHNVCGFGRAHNRGAMGPTIMYRCVLIWQFFWPKDNSKLHKATFCPNYDFLHQVCRMGGL